MSSVGARPVPLLLTYSKPHCSALHVCEEAVDISLLSEGMNGNERELTIAQ